MMSQGRKRAPEPTLFVETTDRYRRIPRGHFYERLGQVLDLSFVAPLTAPPRPRPLPLPDDLLDLGPDGRSCLRFHGVLDAAQRGDAAPEEAVGAGAPRL